jgi:hypothetical protein
MQILTHSEFAPAGPRSGPAAAPDPNLIKGMAQVSECSHTWRCCWDGLDRGAGADRDATQEWGSMGGWLRPYGIGA